MQGFRNHRSVSYDRQIGSCPQNGFPFRMKRMIIAFASAGIADCCRTAALADCGFQHGLQFRKTRGTEYLHTWYRSQIRYVKDPVMRFSVAADQPRTIHTEHHMHSEQGYIVDHHIKATLQKTGINGKYRDQALLCHSGGHGGSMSFRNPDIYKALRVFFCKTVQSGTARHGGRNGNKFRMLLCQPADFDSEPVGKRFPAG